MVPLLSKYMIFLGIVFFLDTPVFFLDLPFLEFFGIFYVSLPHGFILFFRVLWGIILSIYAFISVLFTAKFPKGAHTFLVETIRWNYRVLLYMGNMTDVYPPFSGKETANDQ